MVGLVAGVAVAVMEVLGGMGALAVVVEEVNFPALVVLVVVGVAALVVLVGVAALLAVQAEAAQA